MSTLIEIDKLSKRFGALTAVDDVSFHVSRGEVLGFLGPNGAGKTTTMRMITGFLQPDQGRISVCGHDVLDDDIAAKAAIGYLPEGAPLYGDMTPLGLLHFVADVRQVDAGRVNERLDWVISRLGLEPVLEQSIDTLSKGFKRRVGLAQALFHDPEVLILDEPTDGLDPNQKHEVRMLINELARDKAIIISTHILEEVDAVCGRAVVINHGRIVADGTPGELAARSRFHNAVTLTVRGASVGDLESAFGGLSGVETISVETIDAERVQCTLFPDGDGTLVTAVSHHLQSTNWTVDRLAVESGRLEDVFRSITMDEPAEGPSQ